MTLTSTTDAVWNGEWVARRLDIGLLTAPGSDIALTDLVGLAIRRNPRRAHLLVSSVLGKHVPVDPDTVHDAGLRLGAEAAEVLDGRQPGLVLAFAETATALGASVATALRVDSLHSTRRRVAGVAPVGGFEEEHSHATSHLLLPADPEWLRRSAPLVLVDDELSTGRTALNTIAALQRLFPRSHYVLAALVDLRGPADIAACESTARELRTHIDVVSLAAGSVTLPVDILARGAALVAVLEDTEATFPPRADGDVRRIEVSWPRDVPECARHGLSARHSLRLDERSDVFGRTLRDGLAEAGVTAGRRVLVLGTEELMDAPLRLARSLKHAVGAPEVWFSTTTRSPVLAVDDPGYAIRSTLTFTPHDVAGDGPGDDRRFAHNVLAGGGARAWDAVVVVVDEVGDTPSLHACGGLLDVVAGAARQVFLVTLPTVLASPARS